MRCHPPLNIRRLLGAHGGNEPRLGSSRFGKSRENYQLPLVPIRQRPSKLADERVKDFCTGADDTSYRARDLRASDASTVADGYFGCAHSDAGCFTGDSEWNFRPTDLTLESRRLPTTTRHAVAISGLSGRSDQTVRQSRRRRVRTWPNSTVSARTRARTTTGTKRAAAKPAHRTWFQPR